MKYSLLFLALLGTLVVEAQETSNIEKLPYAEIPEYPEAYTAENVTARMIDGLGFRYYWATEGLRSEDLDYKPSEKGRTTNETLDHLYNLCEVIFNAAHQKPTVRGEERKSMNFEEKRRATLFMIRDAANKLRNAPQGTLEKSLAVFQRGDKSSEYPFWNMINGPIADAVWHVGQVVLLRRASGNPFNSNVSVFRGRLRDAN